MKIMDRLFRLLGSRSQVASRPQSHLLDSAEIRLIVDGIPERLTDFISSPRLHAVDSKGDTPLHLAARNGNLVLCDLFIRAGANPGELNHERQTPADVAFAEGHHLASKRLSSLAPKSLDTETDEKHDEIHDIKASADKIEVTFEPPAEEVLSMEQIEGLNDLDDVLSFEAEDEPEDFFGQSARKAASGTFVALVSQSPTVSTDDDKDWELDLSPAQIAGDGIGSRATIALDQGGEHDFLKVRNRGRRSIRRVVVQPGTRLSIDPEICMTWAEDILAKGWCSLDDMETLVARCEGNGDPEELRTNLQRNLEAAGLDMVDQASEYGGGFWDARSDVLPDELAEAIEATCTRATRLPGTRRFIMDKSDEQQLLEPIMRAKQELQLSMLACEAAVETILDVVDRIRNGLADHGSVTLRSIIPARLEHAETAEFFEAAEVLKLWHANGRVMDGKRRREALAALEALDLSLAFHKEIVQSLEALEASIEDATRLDGLIAVFETAAEHLILEHLPYARRFAARNVEDGEDPEEVFQVAFTGLQRSTRRFDPERGTRFVVYCSFWMKHALTRWRVEEGAAIRVPSHRHENLAKLDQVTESLDIRADGPVSDADLAAELGWTSEEVRQLRKIPRKAEYPEGLDAWDDLLPQPEIEDFFDQSETERIVADTLAQLQERQADVIRMRFGIGLDAEMTLEEIGQFYGVTRERIRQIEAKALDFLSHPGRKRRLQALLGM